MKINLKTVIIVLPLIIGSLIFTGYTSYLSGKNGITEIATEYLSYKLDVLQKYAESQWELLVANDLAGQQKYIDITESTVESYARSIIRKKSELIFAVDADMNITMSSTSINPSQEERADLKRIRESGYDGWAWIVVEGQQRVSQFAYLEQFDWLVFVTELEKSFYSPVNRIFFQTGLIMVITIILSALLLIFFSNFITKPVKNLSKAMQEIIADNDLKKKVSVQYNDEVGNLGYTFNNMISQLQHAYGQIRRYALKAVAAKNDEMHIRNIFQKYVPKDVIDQLQHFSDANLTGEPRELAVLYADIRSFGKMLNLYPPVVVTTCLSEYFGLMVETIMNNHGIADKYIGDKLQAFFGAPVQDENDAKNAVTAALQMLENVEAFNKDQEIRNLPEFQIGIGLSWGETIVGNIGSEKKMDYTILGTTVSTATKLERLTRTYNQPLLISESVFVKIQKEIPCRLVDHIKVKGINDPFRVYAPKKKLSGKEKLGWKYHRDAMQHYYSRDFQKASALFEKVQEVLLNDLVAEVYLDRCIQYLETPPHPDWDGIELL